MRALYRIPQASHLASAPFWTNRLQYIQSVATILLYADIIMESSPSHRRRPIQWLKPGEVLSRKSPVSQPTTTALQSLRRLEQQVCVIHEKLDQMAAATLPPCDLPSMSAAELLELLE